jgi:Protein of unknown function (DUF3102)
MLPARATFTYDVVPAVTAAALRAQASRIRKMVSGTTKAFIEIGNDLIAVKQSLAHGLFSEWVEAECGFSLSSAENYMRAARFAEGRIATVGILDAKIVYKLSANSAPPEIVQSVLDRAAKGEVVSDGQVRAAFEEARFQKREAERLQKKSQQRADSKRTLARREAERLRYEKSQRQEEERRQQAVLSIIDTLGEENARFLIDALGAHDQFYILDLLRTELSKLKQRVAA